MIDIISIEVAFLFQIIKVFYVFW